jgi:hypothetical protein
MAKVIIGIHGLANKPPRETLAKWWKASIREGLQHVGAPDAEFELRMVFWADLLYANLLHEDPRFRFDPLYNAEPYHEAREGDLVEYRENWVDKVRATVLDWGGSLTDYARQKFDLDVVASWLLGKLLRDLAFYYDEEREIHPKDGPPARARTILDATLKEAVLAAAGDEIFLIAHSMGSIIAYNTLRDIGRSDPECKVAEFVTIGSPLGLPYVKNKIKSERDYDPDVRTPTCVTGSWTNYADRKDPVAIDIRLQDDYGANSAGVRVGDDLIHNDYHSRDDDGKDKKRNPHKSYGYLRTPELSRQIKAFLDE